MRAATALIDSKISPENIFREPFRTQYELQISLRYAQMNHCRHWNSKYNQRQRKRVQTNITHTSTVHNSRYWKSKIQIKGDRKKAEMNSL